MFFLICISWAKNQLMGRKTVEKTAERKGGVELPKFDKNLPHASIEVEILSDTSED